MTNILFLLIVFLSNIIQCITGFAGTILAMPFATMVVGFAVAKPALNAVAVAGSLGVAATNVKSINFKELFKICGIMLSGIAISYLIKDTLMSSEKLLYILLGSLTIGVSLFNFIKLILKKETKNLPVYISIPLLVVAGLVHGVFVCGGPLLVIYAADKLRDTKQFRATLSAVWVILNSMIFVLDIVQGAFLSRTTTLTLLSIIVLIAAVFIGNILSKKLSKSAFLILTYLLMIISGVSLLLK